jgi:hypothetical protein
VVKELDLPGSMPPVFGKGVIGAKGETQTETVIEYQTYEAS